MKTGDISRATLGRLPVYLNYLNSLPVTVETISATSISKGLCLGEVQVRKDLGTVCGAGKPKVGYEISTLKKSLEDILGNKNGAAVIVGAGRLGRALYNYKGFKDYGLNILAAFDSNKAVVNEESVRPIFYIDKLNEFCRKNNVKIGIITVPETAAQTACDLLCNSGVKAIWNFSPTQLKADDTVTVQNENLSLSLAYLKLLIN